MIKKNYLAKLFSLIIIGTVLLIKPALASSELFIVTDVPIYGESMNLFDAKIEAIDIATINSFTTLLERLLPYKLHWHIKNIKNKAYEAVIDTKIKEERMTAFTYSAKGDFFFNEKVVKSLLNHKGIFYLNHFSPSQLIIPVIMIDNQYLIWEDDDWLSAWGNMPNIFGLLKLTYLIGDLEDEYLLDSSKIPNAQFKDFTKILAKYNAQELIILIGKPQADKFKIEVKHLTLDGIAKTTLEFDLPTNANYQKFYESISRQALRTMDSYYKHYNNFE